MPTKTKTRRAAVITKTLRQIDRRVSGGRSGATVGQLRRTLKHHFSNSWETRAVILGWQNATGAGPLPKLTADEASDALYCAAWCRAYRKPAAEYVAIVSGAYDTHEAAQELAL